MANIGQSFNSAEVQPNQFECIPKGDYLLRITDSDVKDNSKQTGQILNLTIEVADGQYQGRKLFDQINLSNPNEMAVKIGRERLSAYCHATGVGVLNDSQQLHGIVFKGKVVIKVDKDGQYDDRNEIRSIKKLEAGEGQQGGFQGQQGGFNPQNNQGGYANQGGYGNPQNGQQQNFQNQGGFNGQGGQGQHTGNPNQNQGGYASGGYASGAQNNQGGYADNQNQNGFNNQQNNQNFQGQVQQNQNFQQNNQQQNQAVDNAPVQSMENFQQNNGQQQNQNFQQGNGQPQGQDQQQGQTKAPWE